ncbi:Uncharacterised protein [Segatella copri]|nr:Uncharacterised protein [Segatella copri]
MDDRICRPFLLHLFDGKALEQFFLTLEVSLEGRYKQGFSESAWATQKMKLGIMSQLIDDSRLVSIEVIPLHDFGERLYSQRISL